MIADRRPLLTRLAQRLGSPRADMVIIALALLLLAPSLTVGWATDDHLHRVRLRDEVLLDGFRPTRLDLFVFASGDPRDMGALMDRGVFPWTTDPELRLAFWRPLSAATHALDDALWPESTLAAHAHNLAWFALLLVVVARLYRRVQIEPWLAGLTLLLYALDDVHGPTVGWVANRQAIVSAVFGFAAVLAYDRERRAGWRPGRVVTPACLALSLLAGESGVATLGYLAAHALTLDRAPLRARVGALVPSALVFVAWGVGYVALGYGARGSGLYLEPLRDPLGFAAAAARHLPVLVTGQMAGVWSEFYAALTGTAAHVFVAACAVYVLLLLDALKVLLRVSAEARFWALGMLLSLLPIASTIPADRLLIFVGVGAMGLVACFFRAPEGEPGVTSPSRVRRVSVRLWTGGLVLTHIILAPLVLPVRALSMNTVGASLERADQSVPRGAEVTGQTVVAVNPPADPYLAFVPIKRASERQPIPGRLRWLAVGQSVVEVTREDAQTLLVRPAAGYLAMASERLVRGADRPLALGARVALAGVTVEVTALTEDGRPQATRWRFELPLEDPSFVWLQWSDAGPGFVPWRPPAVGEHTTLPAIDTLRAFLGD